MRFDEVDPETIITAISELSPRNLKLILTIYHSLGCMMTSDELKAKTGMLPVSVGHAGKQLGRLCGVDDFGSYLDGKKYHVAYFQMIGNYDQLGWVMNHNLRIAIKHWLFSSTKISNHKPSPNPGKNNFFKSKTNKELETMLKVFSFSFNNGGQLADDIQEELKQRSIVGPKKKQKF